MQTQTQTDSSSRIPTWMLVVLAAEVAIAVAVRLEGPVRLLGGEGFSYYSIAQLVGLGVTPLMAITIVRIYRIAHASSKHAAKAARQRGDDLMAVSPVWMWTIDADGVLLETNDAVSGALGYDAETLLGTSTLRLMHSDSRDLLAQSLVTGAATDSGWTDRVSSWKHRDGSRRYLRSSGIPVRDEVGVITGFRGASEDVTSEARAAEAQATARDQHVARHQSMQKFLTDETLLIAVYQPIIRIADNRLLGVEALARFQTDPYQTPDIWFAEAADLGMGRALEMTAIRRAAPALAALSSDQYLSLNLSADTLCSEELLEFLLSPDVAPDRIVFELTEHAIVDDYERLNRQMTKLRRLGTRLAIDDAGAGYASLHHILRLRPDFIKLDRAITASVDTDPVRKALTSAMVEFASDVGAVLIAEGVEQPAEMEALRTIGVPCAQGYVIGKPAPIDQYSSSGLLLTTKTPDNMCSGSNM